ncbi:MAG: bifunctional phosphoribosylaminoimidazolecarboxamide formyltransferase/IMP cyclohydrolase [Arachnia sp.]
MTKSTGSQLDANQETASTRNPVLRALVSVYDKAGLEDLGNALHRSGVEIVSTGSTAARLSEAGIPVTAVEDVTGFPECLDGRVKTLHPFVHAGILADRRLPSHVQQLADMGIAPFDLVVVNLYPFTETVASGAGPDECVEQIDIGGPTMVRAAAKNHPSVAVVTSPQQYDGVLAALEAGGFTLTERQELAAVAFRHTASYDVAVAGWISGTLAQQPADGFPNWLGSTWQKEASLRYGENSHQAAALYSDTQVPRGITQAELLHGKPMSFNNYTDGDAALRAAFDFDEPCVAIIKHANPCGIALGEDVAQAHRRAHACDPVSAFGGVIAANRPISVEMARAVSEVFTEVVIAPGFDEGVLEILGAKKNIRLLRAPHFEHAARVLHPISGGALVQQPDRIDAPGDAARDWQLAAGEAVDDATLADLEFAWRACRSVKSNAILLAAGRSSVGVGMGQVNRVDSCTLAVERAGERAAGSVAASDAFFPFSDGPQILIEAGITAIVQPGGSMRDEETIALCREHGVSLYLTGTRHFFH